MSSISRGGNYSCRRYNRARGRKIEGKFEGKFARAGSALSVSGTKASPKIRRSLGEERSRALRASDARRIFRGVGSRGIRVSRGQVGNDVETTTPEFGRLPNVIGESSRSRSGLHARTFGRRSVPPRRLGGDGTIRTSRANEPPGGANVKYAHKLKHVECAKERGENFAAAERERTAGRSRADRAFKFRPRTGFLAVGRAGCLQTRADRDTARVRVVSRVCTSVRKIRADHPAGKTGEG